MRLVVDTNVLLSAILRDGACRELVRTQLLPHELFVSKGLLDELEEKLRKKFRRDPVDVPLVDAYRRRAQRVRVEPLPAPVCRDPDDDLVLATAIAARADAIITGDNDLVSMGSHEGIVIVTPRAFLSGLA